MSSYSQMMQQSAAHPASFKDEAEDSPPSKKGGMYAGVQNALLLSIIGLVVRAMNPMNSDLYNSLPKPANMKINNRFTWVILFFLISFAYARISADRERRFPKGKDTYHVGLYFWGGFLALIVSVIMAGNDNFVGASNFVLLAIMLTFPLVILGYQADAKSGLIFSTYLVWLFQVWSWSQMLANSKKLVTTISNDLAALQGRQAALGSSDMMNFVRSLTG